MECHFAVGCPAAHEGLALFPLMASDDGPADFTLAHHAIRAGQATAEEVNPAGTIPQVRVVNHGPSSLLFLEGEELIGAKQNRMLAASVLVPAGVETILPVCCVEQGRWSYTTPRFCSSGRVGSIGLRYAIKASVTRSLRVRWGYRADQVGVWQEIERQQATLGVRSDTAAWCDSVAALGERLAVFHDRMPYVDGASGMAVALGGRVVAVDFFDSAAICRQFWTPLVTAAALDACERTPVDPPPNCGAVEEVLRAWEQIDWWDAAALGQGRQRRFGNGQPRQGSLLLLGDRVVHGSMIEGAGL